MSGTHSLDQSISSAVTLTTDGAYLTPFTVTSSGSIDSASIGLYGITLAPYLLNEGAISGQTAAVSLALGGTIYNAGAIYGGIAAYGSDGAGGIILGAGTLSLYGAGVVIGGSGFGGLTLAGYGGTGSYIKSGGTFINGGPALAGNTIIGGAGGAISGNGFAADGGAGVMLGAATMVNYGSVSGGIGGYSQGHSGSGGVGAYLLDAAELANFGVISGGEAGDGTSSPGFGGDGAMAEAGASISNAGLIIGGSGMSNGVISSDGGVGVGLAPGAYLGNLLGGTVRGGSGGGSNYAASGGSGVAVDTSYMSYYGVVTLVSAASLVNLGDIYGGQGGYSGASNGGGGFGGAGVELGLSASFTNAGTIVGGAGGTGGYGGYGAAGVEVAPAGTLTNQGLIIGGAGGAGRGGHGGDGATGSVVEIINAGSILGGAAGADGGTHPGYGGDGIRLYAGYLNNSGNITGGQGGAYTSGGSAGAGGDGLFASGVDVMNTGTITGAAAVYRGVAGAGLNAAVHSVSLMGNGTISGGSGYAGLLAGGTGGDGVIITDATSVYNAGNLIQGGAGGDGAAGNAGAGGTGARLSSPSYLYNAGIILGGAGGANISGAGDGGSGGAGAYLAAATDLYNAGIILGGAGGASSDGNQGAGGVGVYIAGGALWNAGTIAGGEGFGGQADAVSFAPGSSGELVVTSGAMFGGLVAAQYGANDLLALYGTGTLGGFGTEFTGFDTLGFEPGAEWDVVGNTVAFGAATIAAFSALDTLDISNLGFAAPESLSLSGDTLTVTEGAASLNIVFEDSAAPYGFTITSDGSGGTDIAAALCFVRGTRILTPTGEAPIESLRIGDALITRYGGIQNIRWIGKQSYDWRFIGHNQAKIPVRIAAGALADGMPARELAVSPGHSLLLGETLVLARDLVNGVTITQDVRAARDTGMLEYFQIELDTHDGLIAEGCWAESYADAPGLRAQFHNAASYYALYPDSPPPDDLRLCAARPEHGPKLAAALLPVVARAWAAVTPGPLAGQLERIGGWHLEGWAYDQAHPSLPVMLEVWLGDQCLGLALAHAPKIAARCAFRFASPIRLGPEDRKLVSIRRQQDGAELAMPRDAGAAA